MSNLPLIKKFRASLGLRPAEPITALPSVKKLLAHSDADFLVIILDDVPFWRRGLSSFQYSKFDKLYQYIRDDIYEGTAYRVKRALCLIGLTKNFTNKSIKHYIDLCRGDDLAFLWFLLQGEYGIPTAQKVTVEQQTLMTGIAHLDMLTTLHELDQVLPKPKRRPKDPRLVQNEEEMSRLKKIYQRSINFDLKNNVVRPYTQSLRMPMPYGKTLILKKPPMRSVDRKKHTVQINRHQRWFESYHYPQDESLIPQKTFKSNVCINHTEDEVSKNCMKQYLEIRNVEKNLEETLKSIAIKNCNEQYKSEIHRQEVLAKLEEQVNFFMNDFYKCSEKYRLRPLVNYVKYACDCSESFANDKKVVQVIQSELNCSRSVRTEINTPTTNDISESEATSSDNFFHAPENHTPYRFEYAKVFSFNNNKTLELLEVVKKEIEQGRLRTHRKRKCVGQDEKKLISLPSIEDDYFDCNDLMLMHNMLRDALEYLAQNPKFVLPALPDAHKLVMLREYIVTRYGKRYTSKEQNDATNLAIRSLKILKFNFKRLHLPAHDHILEYRNKKYDMIERIRYLVRQRRERFFEKVQNQILSYSRNVWAGTRSATVDIRTRMYFAYLPACPKDVQTLFASY